MSTVRIVVTLDDGTALEAEEYFGPGNSRYYAKAVDENIEMVSGKIIKAVQGMYGDIRTEQMP